TCAGCATARAARAGTTAELLAVLFLQSAREPQDGFEDLAHRVRVEPELGRPRPPRREELRLARRVDDPMSERGLHASAAARELRAAREERHEIAIHLVEQLAHLAELRRPRAEVGDVERRILGARGRGMLSEARVRLHERSEQARPPLLREWVLE